MEIEWNKGKRLTNLKKHKIDFIGSEDIFKGYTISFEDDREYYGEQRFITIGNFQNRIVIVVHTETEDKIRIIYTPIPIQKTCL